MATDRHSALSRSLVRLVIGGVISSICLLFSPGEFRLAVAQQLASELPSEAVLPWQTPAATVGTTVESITLPSSTALPLESISATALPVAPLSDQPSKTPKLPGEHVLALISDQGNTTAQPTDASPDATTDQSAQQDNQAGGDADSDVSPGEVRPWLRLNYAGHTERVRALAISDDGLWAVSGGEDKVLHVWQRTTERGWIHRRAIRWQIERGPRGRIYRVAIRGNVAALAGHGALGGLGEIALVDITTGQLQRALIDNEKGHRQTIAQLAWAPGPKPRLASTDVQGQVMVWEPEATTGLWSGRVLVEPDAVTYGAEIASLIKPLRIFVPLAFAGPRHVVVPRFSGATSTAPKRPLWRLQRLAIDGSEASLLPNSEHLTLVSALSGDRDGKKIASADDTGRIRVWNLAQASNATTMTEIRGHSDDRIAQTLCLDPTGRRLAIGDATASAGGVEIWQCPDDASEAKRTGRVATSAAVLSCAFSTTQSSGDELWIAVGSKLLIHDLDAAGRPTAQPRQQLTTSVRPVQRVAFTNEAASYEVAIDYGNGWEDSFDLSEVQIGREAEIDASRIAAKKQNTLAWTARPEPTANGDRYRLFLGDQPRALLPLRPESHGVPTAITEIVATERQPDPAAQNERRSPPQTALAVGTSSRANIYIYQTPLANTDDPPLLLRQFRGHTGDIKSLSTSLDGKYLASCSADATIGLWPLEDLWDPSRIRRLWGLDLTLEPAGLIVDQISDNGPLFFRGVRQGDRLVSIRWADPTADGGSRKVVAPEQIGAALAEMAYDSLVVFEWQRRGEALPSFQSFPAWQPLAQLFVDADREWAMWTPAGIYDASVNGHRRFGWQVNRGVNRLPDFFRADQFRERLERPNVLKQLLRRGSLSAALAATGGRAAPHGESAIVNQLQARPRIEWISPAANADVTGDSVMVEARIHVPQGARLVRPKVYADGVPATTIEREHVLEENGQQVERHRWSVALVSRPQITVEILAATEAGSWDRVTRVVRRTDQAPAAAAAGPAPKAARVPKLRLIAVGVGEYQDRQIQKLDFAARGASEFYQLLAERTAPLYRFDGVSLLDHQAVRPLWHVYSSEMMQQLKADVHADDLVVVYLCGHGLRDRITGRWYFVTADARHSDLMNNRYNDCLSFDDLAELSELRCRKLAILDSCHSGAVQPVMQTSDLKSVLRWLQDDRILTLTASEGHEEAAEDRQMRLGRFTARLLAALEGRADQLQHGGNGDGIVTLQETFAYVRTMLAEDSSDDGFIQRPTAGPSDLFDSVYLPLTAAERL